MKPMAALAGLIVVAGVVAIAQEPGRVVVPARNSSRPRLVDASQTSGSITVKAYNGREVIVETGSSTSPRQERTFEGMKRIDIPWRSGLTVEEDDNVITVRTPGHPSAGLVITVPVDTSLKLKSVNGSITAEGVHGEIEAKTTNARIELTGVSGTVVAETTNGSIHVTMDRIDSAKPMSFSSFNGSVDVTLPPDLKANLKLRTDRGSIWSDFDVRLTGGAVAEKSDSPEGRFRVRLDRTMSATVNGGGLEISFSTYNGSIYIRKKK